MIENEKFGVLDAKDKKDIELMEQLLEEKYQKESTKKTDD